MVACRISPIWNGLLLEKKRSESQVNWPPQYIWFRWTTAECRRHPVFAVADANLRPEKWEGSAVSDRRIDDLPITCILPFIDANTKKQVCKATPDSCDSESEFPSSGKSCEHSIDGVRGWKMEIRTHKTSIHIWSIHEKSVASSFELQVHEYCNFRQHRAHLWCFAEETCSTCTASTKQKLKVGLHHAANKVP